MILTDLCEAASSRTPATLPFQLDKAVILTDLTSERPQWILSAYGPGRWAPAQLFGGPGRELSFEELRVAHYIGLASGNPQQAVSVEDIYIIGEGLTGIGTRGRPTTGCSRPTNPASSQ